MGGIALTGTSAASYLAAVGTCRSGLTFLGLDGCGRSADEIRQ